jgi:hypothetical protein
MDAQTEQWAILPDARIVLSRDRQTFILRNLTEAALQAADLFKAGYWPAGVVAMLPDGTPGGVAEYGCGPLIANALAKFLHERERKPVPPVAWLEKLWAWDGDPRS